MTNEELLLDPYKEPLIPLKKGFGYWGTIATTSDKWKLQCHICGELYESLSSHIVKVHKLKPNEYRQKFKLAAGTPLVSEVSRAKRIEAALNVPSLVRLKRLTVLEKGREESYSKRVQAARVASRRKSLEQKNREGRCPDQLLQKIKDLAQEVGKPPSMPEFRRKYGNGYLQSVIREFGSWNNAKKILRIPVYTPLGIRRAPNYNEEFLVVLLQDFYERFGRKPSQADCGHNGLPTRYPFYRVFGSWGKALAKAFNKYDTRELTKEERGNG